MYLFDLEDYATIYREPTHFNCSGYYNGKQSWLSDDTTIKVIWDNTLTPNCWRLSGDSLGNTQIINTNPASPPINGNWTVVGASYFVTANKGACAPSTQLVMSVTKNNPTCECDASITVLAQGGKKPYQYSFDNGVTYVNSPIKTGLCGDLSLTVMTKDSLGVVVSQLVQIPPQEQIKTYVFRFEIVSSENIGGVQQSTYEVRINPPLPNGVTLNLGLKLTGRFARTPFINSATGTYNHQVKKNGVLITSFTDNTNETTMQNSNSGCQGYLVYLRNYEYLYSNLQITASDTIEIKVNTGVQLTCSNTPPTQSSVLMGEENDTTLGPLGYGRSAATTYMNCCSSNITHYVDASSLTLDGCDCCVVGGYTKSLYE
jgi:hypothetical protein